MIDVADLIHGSHASHMIDVIDVLDVIDVMDVIDDLFTVGCTTQAKMAPNFPSCAQSRR